MGAKRTVVVGGVRRKRTDVVLQVVDSLRRGGAETLVADLVAELDEAGLARCAVVLVDGSDADPELLERVCAHAVEVRDLGGLPLYDPRIHLRMRAAIAATRPRLVHSHLVYASVTARLVARSLRRKPLLVTTIHTAPGPVAHSTKLRTEAEVRTAGLSDVLVAPSPALAAAYGAVSGKAVEVVATGVRPRATDTSRDRRNTRSGLGIRGDDMLVIGVSRLDPGKGFDDLARAAGALRKRSPVAVALAGDGPARGLIAAVAQESEAGPGFALLGQRSDVGDLLAAADVFCLPSHHEALPVSVLEAMHAGLPVVATTVGALPDVVEHGRSGILFEPGDADALAAALERLAASPDLRRAMGERGRAIAAQRHSLAAMARGYAALYDARAPAP